MTNDQNNTSTNNDVQAIKDQLRDLAEEAKKMDEEMDATSATMEEELDDIESEIDASIAKMEQTFSELDEIEKKAGDEMDTLVLNLLSDLSEK